jgi:hypothetical protein
MTSGIISLEVWHEILVTALIRKYYQEEEAS